MKKHALFITRLYKPHVGGVEGQLQGLCNELLKRDYSITIITENTGIESKNNETLDGVEILRLSYPKIKAFGLVYIWVQLLIKLRLFYKSDIIHCFGSFIWILPVRLLLFCKSYSVTFFGWEGISPIPVRFKILRYLAFKLNNKSLSDADFIQKHYGIQTAMVRYASTEKIEKASLRHKKNQIVYVGRLDKNTGIEKLIETFQYVKQYPIYFCGDGELKNVCKKFGSVQGFINPSKYYTESRICLSAGHTSIIEAFFHKCFVITTYNNKVKKDYLLMTPFKDWIVVEKDPKKLAEKINYYMEHPEEAKPMIDEAYKWVQGQTWEKMADTYEKLWGVK